MKKLPNTILNKLQKRINNNALRVLKKESNLIDFSSNDYLGFAKNKNLFKATHNYLIDNNIYQNGASGSRLLSGNYALYPEVETITSKFHQSETATIFNSGYDANVGFFSSIPQRGDVVLYDEFIHASIRDGILLSNAKAYKYKHNNTKHLATCIAKYKENSNTVYVVTESVFSMDGDSPNLKEISNICKKNEAFLIVDEAHAIGVFGKNGCGLVQELGIENKVFARVVTFGKALGCHGAAILGSKELQQYLVNFARSFIYTTGLPPHSLSSIRTAYCNLNNIDKILLQDNIRFFKLELEKLNLDKYFIKSTSAIFSCVISGNEKVKSIAKKLQEHGFSVMAVLSPTVPENKERLRFCLHSYNTKNEISNVLQLLHTFLNE